MSAAAMSATAILHRPTVRLVGWQLSNVLRSRWLLGYALFFLLVTDAMLRFGGGSGKALLSLMNVVLLVVPLVATVFGTTWLYDAREFTEVLLAQPIARGRLFIALYLGLALPLALALVAGVGIPFAVHGFVEAGDRATLATLLLTSTALTLSFVAIAFLIAVRAEDKVKGLGTAIVTWLALTLVYDGLVLVVTTTLGDYPIERPLLGMLLLNPVDLARVQLLLRFDVSALMGYTGAVFADFFGGRLGPAISAAVLLLWIVVPAALGLRAFRRKDF
jgi:Cu-processing system permease protein